MSPRSLLIIMSPRSSYYISLPFPHQGKIMTNEGFPSGSEKKNPPVMQETEVHPLGREDPLKKEPATHSSIPAWRIPWTEEPGGL